MKNIIFITIDDVSAVKTTKKSIKKQENGYHEKQNKYKLILAPTMNKVFANV